MKASTSTALWQQIARNPAFAIGAGLLLVILLGTDPLGRDYLARVLYGARISLLIGISVAVISGLIGTTMGMLAGYFGGKTDMLVTFLVTTRLSMPVILVAL